ncbi:Transcription factor domain-containing protein [Madurella fahalii]|uniref:Transcription factor domain-containing protein n=1 Tax=Madurella fahalii TaxID=1157608 RepID=A0ABQ0FZU9_9PEZI
MSSRKRVISSCIPCYTRKQKCNREYPCNHCARRQCTEDCVYHSNGTRTASQSTSPIALPEHPIEERSRDGLGAKRRASGGSLSARNEWNAYIKSVMPAVPWSGPSLAESFGYFEDSGRNTLALIQRLGLAGTTTTATRSNSASCPTLIPEAAEEVHRILKRMPDPKILDFLVQYFVTEVNWIEQLVHTPWLLTKYQRWRMMERVTLVAEVDFAIFILRICSYALHFLPSPGYTLDRIRGILLSDIRNLCDETADNLEAISTAADGRGSLIRVQHLTLFGLQCHIEGKTKVFWEVLSRAIRVAQDVGMDCDATSSRRATDKVDREMERRTFCTLYIWDSLLSRQLDRPPFLPGPLCPENRPQVHVLRGGGDNVLLTSSLDAPDPFTERLLQADLADFWRRNGPAQGAEYDMIAAEERHEKFCREYISQLPPVFALKEPDETWDKRFPKLPLQRMLLHIAIYDSMCWNFRPLLLRRPEALAPYKSLMLGCQKKRLAAAALRSLDAITQLHALMGGCHTRLPSIVWSTFEAAVALTYLSTDPLFPGECPKQHIPPPGALGPDPLQAGSCKITLPGCLQAVKGALKRLKMLAEASSMADVAASALIRLLGKASEVMGRTGTEMDLDDGVMIRNQDGATAIATTLAAQRGAISATAGEAPLIQNLEIRGMTTPTTTATAREITRASDTMGGTSAAEEAASWITGDMADLRSVNDFMSTSPTLVVGDMGNWPFETSSTYSQEMDYWTAHRADSGH